MAKNNYLVSVFVDGKNVGSYYSENLDDLMTIKAIHGHCEITIFDIHNFVQFTPLQVNSEIFSSVDRWKNELLTKKEEPQKVKVVVKKTIPKKKKYWERPVLCVETGLIYKNIRECSRCMGIPYMTITNCIKNKNATRGFHFTNAIIYEQDNKQEQEYESGDACSSKEDSNDLT